MELNELLEFDHFLNEISKKISFYRVNPLNIKEEKKKFFEDKNYNPQFKYADLNEDMKKVKALLEENFINTSIIAGILNQKRIEYIKKIEMLSKIGLHEFTHFAVNVYGLPNDELIEKSQNLLNLEESKQEYNLTTDDVKKVFQEAIDHLGFKWNIVTKSMIASAAVSPSKRTLFIKENSHFSDKFLKRLIVHEIGTHALRAENGYTQKFTIFRRGFPGYMGTEEGLAVMNEEIHGVLNKRTLKVYAGRVIAVNMSLSHSFSDVFKYLTKFFDERTAWRITLRAKRGIADTSKPGGLTKDFLYLDGYYKVKKYLEKGNDITKLYHGKIGIEHVALVDQMDVNAPKYLPKDIEVIVNGK